MQLTDSEVYEERSTLKVLIAAVAPFAVAMVAGLAGGSMPSLSLAPAPIAMMVCHPLGLVIGLVCQRVIEEYVGAQPGAHVVPRSGAGATPAVQSGKNAEEVEDVTVV